jgi:hypothetical protein
MIGAAHAMASTNGASGARREPFARKRAVDGARDAGREVLARKRVLSDASGAPKRSRLARSWRSSNNGFIARITSRVLASSEAR